MPWRAASRPTTMKPSERDRARPTSGGRASESLASASWSARMPMPWSVTEIDVAVGLGAVAHDLDPGVRRREVGGVLHQLGEQVGEVGGGVRADQAPRRASSRSMRAKSSTSPRAARTTSASGTGRPRRRGGSAPASTSSDSALRRMRVARWSSLKRFSSWSGSSSLRLELVDELDLAVEERLVAAGQVDEHVADALAEQGGLLGGHLDGHLAGSWLNEALSWASSSLAVDVDVLESGRSWNRLVLGRVPQRLDQPGHLLVGQPVGRLGEAQSAAGDRRGHRDGQDEGGQRRPPGRHPGTGGRPGRPAVTRSSAAASTPSASAPMMVRSCSSVGLDRRVHWLGVDRPRRRRREVPHPVDGLGEVATGRRRPCGSRSEPGRRLPACELTHGQLDLGPVDGLVEGDRVLTPVASARRRPRCTRWPRTWRRRRGSTPLGGAPRGSSRSRACAAL